MPTSISHPFSGGFLGGLLVGSLLVAYWFRSQLKRKLAQLQDMVLEIRRDKTFQPNDPSNELTEILDDVLVLRKKGQQREKKLRKMGKRLNSVLNNMDVGVVVLDLQNQVIFSNNSAENFSVYLRKTSSIARFWKSSAILKLNKRFRSATAVKTTWKPS